MTDQTVREYRIGNPIPALPVLGLKLAKLCPAPMHCQKYQAEKRVKK